MLLKPTCLLKLYGTFSPSCIDYVNISKGYALSKDDQSQTLFGKIFGKIKKLVPSKFSIDLGSLVKPIAGAIGLGVPEIRSEWEPQKLEDRIGKIDQLDDVGRHQLYREAQKLQEKLIKKGHYAHNVQVAQALKQQDSDLLQLLDSGAKPLLDKNFDDGTLLVIDAMLSMVRTADGKVEFEICDYPALVRKPHDKTMQLKVSDTVATKLEQLAAIKNTGWHPYCRILGIYSSSDTPKYIEPLLIYIRDVDLIPESIADEILKEWKDEHAVNASTEAVRWGDVVTEINLQFTVKKENNPDFDIEEGIRNSRHILLDENLPLKGYIDAVKTYEDDIFAGHYGFLLNLYHFLSTYDREANANAISKIYYKLKRATAPFIDDIDEEFKERMKYLRPLDILRFDESVISLFIPIFDGSRVVGDSSTVI